MTWLMACGLAAMVVLFVIALLGMIHLARRDKETDDRRTAEQFGPTFDRWGMPRPQVRRRARHRATAYRRMVRLLRSVLRRLEPVAVETVPTPAVQPPAPTVPVGPPPPWPGVDADVAAGELSRWRTFAAMQDVQDSTPFTQPAYRATGSAAVAMDFPAQLAANNAVLRALSRNTPLPAAANDEPTTLLPPVMSEQGGAR
ncbi:hypothetical protein [Micromonospora wenchangensis]|uniref:hypothetical protein n=1 Tax=Micromonospora wenchangensis TaxID=1185415 RepID=UPI0037FAB228